MNLTNSSFSLKSPVTIFLQFVYWFIFFSLQFFHRTQNVCMVGCLFVTRMIPTTWWVTQPSLQCIRLLAITRFPLLQAKTLLLWLLLNSHKPHLVKCLCLKFEHLYNFMHRITSQCLLFPLSYVKVLYVKFSNFFFIVTRSNYLQLKDDYTLAQLN